MKSSGSTESKIQPSEGGVGVGSDNKARHKRSDIDSSGIDNIEVDGVEVEVDEVEKKVQKSSKSKKTVGSLDFLIPGANLAFNELRQAFFKASILYHFDPERYIWMKIDVSGYAIGRVFSQLSLDDLGRWHSVVVSSTSIET